MRPIKLAVSLSFFAATIGLLIAAFVPRVGARAISTKTQSSDGIWEFTRPLSAKNTQTAATGQQLRLNTDALAQQLSRAPMEGSADLRRSSVVLSLPMPDGSFQRFQIQESPIMEPSLAAQLPAVKTYRARSLDDPTATARFDSTPQGFHALILSATESIFIEPASPADSTSYITHRAERTANQLMECGVTEADVAEAAARGINPHAAKLNGITPEVTNGATLRTYRLAVATTGEWFSIYGGGSVGNAQAAIVSLVNQVDAIYEKEVAIRFTVVNNTNIIFTNPATDPYTTNAADNNTLTQNQSTLDNASFLGSANYDIGHVFGGITGLGSGSSSFSGLASIGVTCSAGSKARGVSTMGNNPASVTAAIFVGGVAHEIGHQFSATHTFNASTGSFCSGQRDSSSAYEVGGGSTIMSYQVCGAENLQPLPDLVFHVRSLEQITSYATNSALCAATAATGNAAPAVTGPGNFTIPANTPFQLTATANDGNGPLTYSWEEYDLGMAGPPDTDNGNRPIFRNYKPVTTGTRYFPSLPYILNNSNVPPTSYSGGCFDTNGSSIPCLTGESLPVTNRTMNFQVVVRDNQTNGGAINSASSVLTVVNTAGPFAVTAPNGGENWSGVQNVTWNVANTSGAPISTANVRISLSTNGGLTFPTVLASSVPNTGTASVTLPNGVLSSTCRIKVEAVGNIFFDVSNANFNLAPGDGCPAVSDFNPKAGSSGTVVTITGVNFTGVDAVTFANNVPAASFTVNNATQITATVPNGAVGGPITLSKPGCGNLPSFKNFTVCPAGPVPLSIDDGSVNSASAIPTNGVYYVNRLTPSSYPATLTQVSIFWDPFQSFSPGTAINVVAGANTGGTSNIDGVSFQSIGATAGAQPGFTSYTLPSAITISSGDFVVGFQVPTYPAGSFPVAIDTNNPASRSYNSTNGSTFTNVTNGNYMIRASQVFTNCDVGGASLKILSISRNSNGHISILGVGAPNQVAKLQASPDLSPGSFVTLVPAPDPADGTGLFLYDDADAAGLTKRFYRISP